MPTLAAFERLAGERAANRGVTLTRGDRRRAGKALRRAYEGRMAGRVFNMPDPTPPRAFRDIRRNDLAAARRLGLLGADRD